MERIRDYAVVDLETTGLSPRLDRIIEIGVLVVKDGKPQKSAESVLVKQAEKLPQAIINITGITDDHLRGGIPIQKALVWLVQTTWGLPIVGHNIVRFDVPFLKEEAARSRIDLGPMVKYPIFDTAAYYVAHKVSAYQHHGETSTAFAQRILSQPRKGLRYNLQEACKMMGIQLNPEQMHRAAADVTATYHLFEALQEIFSAPRGVQDKQAARAALPTWMASTL